MDNQGITAQQYQALAASLAEKQGELAYQQQLLAQLIPACGNALDGYSPGQAAQTIHRCGLSPFGESLSHPFAQQWDFLSAREKQSMQGASYG